MRPSKAAFSRHRHNETTMADKKTAAKTETNGALVFEKMPAGFEMPSRFRSGAYDETLDALSKTKEIVCVYNAGKNPKPANTRRKSLIKAAEAKGMEIHAAVRNINGENKLLAQYIGKLAAA